MSYISLFFIRPLNKIYFYFWGHEMKMRSYFLGRDRLACCVKKNNKNYVVLFRKTIALLCKRVVSELIMSLDLLCIESIMSFYIYIRMIFLNKTESKLTIFSKLINLYDSEDKDPFISP